MEYKNLEGRALIFNGREGIVVGCDIDIGITIVSKRNSSDYLMCLIGPSSPLWKRALHKGEDEEKAEYYGLFDVIVGRIKNGRCDVSDIIGIVGIECGHHPSVETCSFAQ